MTTLLRKPVCSPSSSSSSTAKAEAVGVGTGVPAATIGPPRRYKRPWIAGICFHPLQRWCLPRIDHYRLSLLLFANLVVVAVSNHVMAVRILSLPLAKRCWLACSQQFQLIQYHRHQRHQRHRQQKTIVTFPPITSRTQSSTRSINPNPNHHSSNNSIINNNMIS